MLFSHSHHATTLSIAVQAGGTIDIVYRPRDVNGQLVPSACLDKYLNIVGNVSNGTSGLASIVNGTYRITVTGQQSGQQSVCVAGLG